MTEWARFILRNLTAPFSSCDVHSNPNPPSLPPSVLSFSTTVQCHFVARDGISKLPQTSFLFCTFLFSKFHVMLAFSCWSTHCDGIFCMQFCTAFSSWAVPAVTHDLLSNLVGYSPARVVQSRKGLKHTCTAPGFVGTVGSVRDQMPLSWEGPVSALNAGSTLTPPVTCRCGHAHLSSQRGACAPATAPQSPLKFTCESGKQRT